MASLFITLITPAFMPVRNLLIGEAAWGEVILAESLNSFKTYFCFDLLVCFFEKIHTESEFQGINLGIFSLISISVKPS